MACPHGEQPGAAERHAPAPHLPADRRVRPRRDVHPQRTGGAEAGGAEQEVDVGWAQQELVASDRDVPGDVPEEPGEGDEHRAEPHDERRGGPVGPPGHAGGTVREAQEEAPLTRGERGGADEGGRDDGSHQQRAGDVPPVGPELGERVE
jgi:hypothetical protein